MQTAQQKANDNVWRNVEWALRFVWQSGRALTIVNVVLTILQSLLPLLVLYLTKLVIDTVAAGITAQNRPQLFRQLFFIIAATSVVVLLDRVLGTLVNWVRTAQ